MLRYCILKGSINKLCIIGVNSSRDGPFDFLEGWVTGIEEEGSGGWVFLSSKIFFFSLTKKYNLLILHG